MTLGAIGGALVVSQRMPTPQIITNGGPEPAVQLGATTRSAAQSSILNAQSSMSEAPESIVWTMTDAWRAGDVRKYLDCFADPLRAKLQRTADEMGAAKFAEFLKKTNAEVKGLAISGTTASVTDECEVPLEFVYKEKNETQPHLVRKINGTWRIVDVKGTARIPTLVPYGTEVFPQATR